MFHFPHCTTADPSLNLCLALSSEKQQGAQLAQHAQCAQGSTAMLKSCVCSTVSALAIRAFSLPGLYNRAAGSHNTGCTKQTQTVNQTLCMSSSSLAAEEKGESPHALGFGADAHQVFSSTNRPQVLNTDRSQTVWYSRSFTPRPTQPCRAACTDPCAPACNLPHRGWRRRAACPAPRLPRQGAGV